MHISSSHAHYSVHPKGAFELRRAAAPMRGGAGRVLRPIFVMTAACDGRRRSRPSVCERGGPGVSQAQQSLWRHRLPLRPVQHLPDAEGRRISLPVPSWRAAPAAICQRKCVVGQDGAGSHGRSPSGNCFISVDNVETLCTASTSRSGAAVAEGLRSAEQNSKS
ncbi:hypothetical protein BC628DRAFT_1358234 [Trametes gibbosa]|nr:hypothetical protein BC628DRAFT_1358234 [Trametes gibbosa]